MKIHPTAVVSSRAVIHSNVEVGPFCVVEAGVVLGQGCKLEARATVKAETVVGRETVIGEGAVLGGAPQHLAPPPVTGRVIIGERCVLREHVTVHRAMAAGGETRIGNDCFLMVGAHVAHDCRVGNRVILTNNVLLGGFAQVGERAVLGGAAAVHQHCRIGRLAMIAGCARVVQDVPPFVMTDGEGALIVGLNRIGLRRAELPIEEIAAIKAAYRLIYREGLSFEEMLTQLEQQFTAPQAAAEFAPFFRGGKRGFVQERRSPPKTAIRVHPAVDADEDEQAPAAVRRVG